MKTASNPQMPTIATPSAGVTIWAAPAAMPKNPSPSPRRCTGATSATIDTAAVG